MASVFPEPVPAWSMTSLFSRIGSIKDLCAAVKEAKFPKKERYVLGSCSNADNVELMDQCL